MCSCRTKGRASLAIGTQRERERLQEEEVGREKGRV